MSQPGPKTGVPIAAIKTPYHTKPNPDDVAALAASIRELGLLCPPTVDHADGKGYVLVAGRRRLAACYSLGWERIPVHIREQSKAYQDPGVAGQRYRAEHAELLRELATLDENLVREHLTAAQRAEATAKRKTIWEAIHPSATVEEKRKEGAKRTNAKLGRGDAPAKSAGASAAFTKETAARTGRSERSVQVDAQIGAALAESPEAAEVVHSSPKPITQTELLAIAQAKPEDRPAVAAAAVAKAKAPKARRQLHPAVAARSKATSTTVETTDEKAPTTIASEVEAAKNTAHTITEMVNDTAPGLRRNVVRDVLASIDAETRRIATTEALLQKGPAVIAEAIGALGDDARAELYGLLGVDLIGTTKRTIYLFLDGELDALDESWIGKFDSYAEMAEVYEEHAAACRRKDGGDKPQGEEAAR